MEIDLCFVIAILIISTNMIIQNPLLKHWALDNFLEHLYVYGHVQADSESEDSGDEIPPPVFLQDGIVASADAFEQGNLITPERLGRPHCDNFVARAKRQKGSDNVADPTSDSHKFLVRIHLLKTIMKYHVDLHKKTYQDGCKLHKKTYQHGCNKHTFMPQNFNLTKKAIDLDAYITYFLKTVHWNDCIFKNEPSMRKLNSTFFKQWLDAPNLSMAFSCSEESKSYVAKVFAEMAHGLMDHLSVNFVAEYSEDGGLEYGFKIRAQVLSLDMYDKEVMQFRSNINVADWVHKYATDLENFIVQEKSMNPEAVFLPDNDDVDVLKMREIASKIARSDVDIIFLTTMGKLCEFPFLDVGDVDFLNVLMKKEGRRSEFVFQFDENRKCYFVGGDHRQMIEGGADRNV